MLCVQGTASGSNPQGAPCWEGRVRVLRSTCIRVATPSPGPRDPGHKQRGKGAKVSTVHGGSDACMQACSCMHPLSLPVAWGAPRCCSEHRPSLGKPRGVPRPRTGGCCKLCTVTTLPDLAALPLPPKPQVQQERAADGSCRYAKPQRCARCCPALPTAAPSCCLLPLTNPPPPPAPPRSKPAAARAQKLLHQPR